MFVPSETTTACEPIVMFGIVKVTVDAPVPFVVPPAVMVAATPPTVTVNAWFARNPVTLMVTPLVPTPPDVGLSPLTAGVAMTVNALAAVTVPPSGLAMVTLRGPGAAIPVTVTLPVSVRSAAAHYRGGHRDAGTGERDRRAGDEVGSGDRDALRGSLSERVGDDRRECRSRRHRERTVPVLRSRRRCW